MNLRRTAGEHSADGSRCAASQGSQGSRGGWTKARSPWSLASPAADAFTFADDLLPAHQARVAAHRQPAQEAGCSAGKPACRAGEWRVNGWLKAGEWLVRCRLVEPRLQRTTAGDWPGEWHATGPVNGERELVAADGARALAPVNGGEGDGRTRRGAGYGNQRCG